MPEHYCNECMYFAEDDGEIKRDRMGDEWYSLCTYAQEYSAEDDEACDWFVERKP